MKTTINNSPVTVAYGRDDKGRFQVWFGARAETRLAKTIWTGTLLKDDEYVYRLVVTANANWYAANKQIMEQVKRRLQLWMKLDAVPVIIPQVIEGRKNA